MSFDLKTVNSQVWTLILEGLNNVTFHNVGQFNIYINVTETNSPPVENYGVVYAPNTGAIAKPIEEFGAGTYLWAKALSGQSKVVYKTDETELTVTSGSGGASSSFAVTQSVLPTGASTEATLVSINDKLSNTLNVNVTQSITPTGISTENTLSQVLNSLNSGISGDTFPYILSEKFATFPNENWNVISQSSGNIISVDGNAAGSNYLVVSLDPLTPISNTFILSNTSFDNPVELIYGIHFSQRTVGQNFSIGIFSDEENEPIIEDVQISSISQATTTLTVNTATNHGLRIGDRIGIRNVSDSRLNYPSLVVATTPSDVQFTATAGPMGNIPSLTVGPFNSGFVYRRIASNNTKNCLLQVFENSTVTQSSFISKLENFDETTIAGTISGNHSVTIATTASVQAINSALNYAFRPTSEYKLYSSHDRIQFIDSSIDVFSEPSSRAFSNQLIPNLNKRYKVGIYAVNNKSLTCPVAQIVTVTKSGSTTATVTTDVAHGLTTGDYINTYGVRDVTNFPALSSATVVASVINSTQFTVIWGTSSTSTSYGGYVARVNGGQVMQGAISQSASTFNRTSNIITIVGSASWSGLLIGDYVNLIGVRNAVDGSSIGVDGAYRVRNIATSTLTLEPLNAAQTGVNISNINVGGGIIKRTDLRINYLKIQNYSRFRVEAQTKAATDLSGSIPSLIKNASLPVTQSGSWSVTSVGGVAEDAATTANPVIVGGVVRTTPSLTTLVAGDAARHTITTSGALVVQPFAPLEASWQYYSSITGTSFQAKGGVANFRNYVTSFQYQNISAVATDVRILDGSTVIAQYYATANMVSPVSIQFQMPIKANTANAINIYVVEAGATVLCAAQGFQAL